MGLRRSDEVAPTSSRWRVANRSLLGECGVPDEDIGSDRRWVYVLLHGDDYPGTGWDVEWVSPRQAAELLAVLERDLPSAVGYDLVRLLRRRAEADPSAVAPPARDVACPDS
jgi:hypothetical protein